MATRTKNRYEFRPWSDPTEDLVSMDRTLALDLIKCLDVSCFWKEQEEADGDHDPEKCQALFKVHRERMERMAQTLCSHLAVEMEDGITPEIMLRSVVMAHEATLHHPGMKARSSEMATPC